MKKTNKDRGMDFKEFSIWFWALMSSIPFIILITQGWRAVLNAGIGLWYLIALFVYAVACVAEWNSNRKKK